MKTENNLKKIKEYLKERINNSWYVNAKRDYNINGSFVDCLIYGNYLKITYLENGEYKEQVISYYQEYTLEQLYNIWMEG